MHSLTPLAVCNLISQVSLHWLSQPAWEHVLVEIPAWEKQLSWRETNGT
jgi:hypothetical protein